MKNLLLILALLICLSAKGQSSHLPEKVTITLTKQQVVQFASTLDSARNMLFSSCFPANQVNPFINRFQKAMEPFWIQVSAQMLKDTTKKGKK